MSQLFHQNAQLNTHFALIFIDQDGNLRQQISPSIADSTETILSADLITEFMKAVAQSNQGWPSTRALDTGQPDPYPDLSQAAHGARLAGPEQDLRLQHYSSAVVSPSSNSAFTWQTEDRSKADSQRKQIPRIEKHNWGAQMTTISVKDKTFLRRYYEKVFQNLQQTNCRVIAKVYVKVVEPRKQAQYPYNGRKPVAGEMQQFSPEETRPPWWPTGVSHREPDHLLKNERIELLVHILCDLRASHGITAERLKHGQECVKRQIVPPERLQLLDELYRVREQEEKLDAGEITDGSAEVSVSRANLPDSEKCNVQDQKAYRDSPAHQTQPNEHVTQSLAQCSRPEGETISLKLATDPHVTEHSSFGQKDLMSPGFESLCPSSSPGDLKRKRSSFERGALQALRHSSLGYGSSTVFANHLPVQDTPDDSLDLEQQINYLAYYSWINSFQNHV
ncbi:hypothetical protein N7494_001265 [Penicillium frequentans]|uniref:Subtelomeric hrmA-associated cluster protein AFUB-079030/YDR124W-like helical bundle domain-containing protein n=1 Tax=Penicillium frequentans TaxID=3151616 RepID=A0AAD6D7D2_9EURO|nr:hypothetical protein N7494_001265 [Penicillium glabrum]